ncbi:hypothetical protein DFJ63DRAFT_239649 [Scheffersomyces coipomensis]|uniref:uncharacterized protein n=1 Tax=Scheffersomyces coipomensis TaxID=1788519 RepID=UPI00315DBD08
MATQKKYICAFCARAFTRSEHKQRHERSHTNEKPFHCLHCTSSFVRRDLLQRHCRTVHNSQLNPNTLPSNKSLNNPTSVSSSTIISDLTDPIDGSITNNTTTTANSSTSSSSTNIQKANTNGAAGPTTLLSSSASTNSVLDDDLSDSNEPLSPTNNNSVNNNNATNVIMGLTPMTTPLLESIPLSVSNSRSKKRKRSADSDKSDSNHLRSPTQQATATQMTTSSSSNTVSANKDIINHDLIHLLSITKKLQTILVKFDPSNENISLNDHFLIGYIHLLQSSSNFVVFDKILKELIFNLNSYTNSKSNSNLKQQGVQSQSYQQQASIQHQQQQQLYPNNFKIGIIYSIISMGYIINKRYAESILYFKKSWNLLIKKLIPSYNNNNNLLDQIEILNNLYLLSYIYLEYNLESYNNIENTLEEDDTFINNDIILNYLNDISFIIISNLKDLTTSNENLIDLNIKLFWNIYILISNYLKSKPPKFYSFFLNKHVKGSETLLSLMTKFSKNFINLENESDFLKMIIISTLSNELKNFDNAENFLIFSSKNCLHNSIILINKSINIHQVNRNSIQIDSSHLKLFELFKKNIIISSPLKFHELLNNYLFIPQSYFNWDLLNLTLQEINLNYPINQTLREFLLNPHILIDGNIKNLFNFKSNPIDINNNLSIISFPIIFFSNYLNLGIIDFKKFNLIQIHSISMFLFEWYLIMIKILFIIWNNHDLFNNNYILQNLVYLLLDNKSALNKKLNIESTSMSSTSSNNSPSLSPPIRNSNLMSNNNSLKENDEFLFNNNWFMILKYKFTTIFDNWMTFTLQAIQSKYDTNNNNSHILINNLSLLKVNVYKITNEIVQQELMKLSKEEQPLSINPTPPTEVAPSSSSYLGQLDNTGYNYNDYNANIGGYRRSNSITIGVLANSHATNTINSNNDIQNSPIITGGTSFSNSNSSHNMNNSNANNNNANSSNKFNYYSSYSTYPPPPPILSSSSLSLNNSNTPSNEMTNSNTMMGQSNSTGSDFLLPPILPKGSSGMKVNDEVNTNDINDDGKTLKTLIPNVLRK